MRSILNALLEGKARLCNEASSGIELGFYKGLTVIQSCRGLRRAQFTVKDRGEACARDVGNEVVSKFRSLYNFKPLIVVDALFWELHHEEEKAKAVKQLLTLFNVVRRYMTSLNVVLVSPPQGLARLVRRLGLSIPLVDESVYSRLDPRRTVLLDPYAEVPLTDGELAECEAYVVGLIVDSKFPRPYATAALSLIRGLRLRRALKLGESVVGVPSEINKVAEVLLRARFLGVPLERCIIDAMDVSDKVERALYEYVKARGPCGNIDFEALAQIAGRLGLEHRYWKRILSRLSGALRHCGGQDVVS